MVNSNKDFFVEKKEWSEIKDKLLDSYLLPYFQKILATRRDVVYIDCFSGKGKFDDGKDGSPLIAMKAINKSLENTKYEQKIYPFFIEKKYAEELKINLSKICYKCEQPQIISGNFEDEILNIINDKRFMHYNIFLYIDPYGIKALNYNLFKEIFNNKNISSVEMLINFNSFGFLRNACRAMSCYVNNEIAENDMDIDNVILKESGYNLTNSLTEIIGTDVWKNIMYEYKKENDSYKIEQQLSTIYKKKLSEICKYVLDMPIRLRPEQQPKYRMIHLSNHEQACYLMLKNIEKRKDELYVNVQAKNQPDLFQSDLEGEFVDNEDVEICVISLISSLKQVYLTTFMVGFFCKYGFKTYTDKIWEILNKLETENRLKIIREPKFTKTGKLSIFKEEGHDKKILLEWIG